MHGLALSLLKLLVHIYTCQYPLVLVHIHPCQYPLVLVVKVSQRSLESYQESPKPYRIYIRRGGGTVVGVSQRSLE